MQQSRMSTVLVMPPPVRPKVGSIESLNRQDPCRTRALARLNEIFIPYNLDEEIQLKRLVNQEVKILEFGMGHGRVVVELAKKYPDIEVHGINKHHWGKNSDEVFRETGIEYGIFSTREEALSATLPFAHAWDATSGFLPLFTDNAFDIVFSQFAVYSIERKDILLQEFWRILKPGGILLTELGNIVIVKPEVKNDLSLKEKIKMHISQTSQPALEEAKKQWNLTEFFLTIQEKGFSTTILNNKWCTLCVKKNKLEPLDLGLQFIENDARTYSIFKRTQDC